MGIRCALVMGALITSVLAACSSDDGGPLLRLRSRAEASFEVTAKVSYEWTFSSADPSSKLTMTVTQGPLGRRLDTSVGVGDRTYKGTLLDLRDEDYLCGEDAAGTPGCRPAADVFTSSDDTISTLTDFTFELRQQLVESDEVEVINTSSRQLLGMDAGCFEVAVDEPEHEEAEICFSSDDILLSFAFESAETSGSIVATEVDRHVSAEDFALPYPLVEGRP